MPLIKNTETGNNYLEKTNTGGDACGRTAIRSYEKQLGLDGDVVNTVFTLPWYYIPESHTLWIYVNGQKAEYIGTVVTPSTEQLLQYSETSNQEITFHYPLENTDVIEFIVAGNYSGDAEGILAPDLSIYKTKDASNVFTEDQPMGSSKFTQLGVGGLAGLYPEQDSVNVSQLGSQIDGAGVHFHSQLMNSVGTEIVVSTVNAGRTEVNSILDVNGNKIEDVDTPIFGGDATNKTYVDGTYENIEGYYYDMKLNVWVAGPGAWGYFIHPGNFMSWWGTVTCDLDGWYHQMNIITKMAIHPTATFSWTWSKLLGWSPTPIEIFAWIPQTTDTHDYSLWQHSSDGANTISIRALHGDGVDDAVNRGFAINGYAKI